MTSEQATSMMAVSLIALISFIAVLVGDTTITDAVRIIMASVATVALRSFIYEIMKD